MRSQYRTELHEVIPKEAWIFTDDNNISFYPGYLYIPYEMVLRGISDFRNIPRCFGQLLDSPESLSFMKSSYFLGFMLNCYSMMVWQVLSKEYKLHPVIQVYSEDNPIVMISRMLRIWLNELETANILPTKETLWSDPFYRFHMFGYQNFESAVENMTPIVLDALKKYGLDKIIQLVKKIPCHEDFSSWHSTSRIDFERKWYHTRTKRRLESLELVRQQYAADHDGAEWDAPDETVFLEKDVVGSVHAELFINTLPEKDRKILKLRLKEKTMQQIADELGYKTHSAVLKRLKKIGEAYRKYAGDTLGLEP